MKNLLVLLISLSPVLLFASTSFETEKNESEIDTIMITVDLSRRSLQSYDETTLTEQESSMVLGDLDTSTNENTSAVLHLVDKRGNTVEMLAIERKEDSIDYLESIDKGDYYIRFVHCEKKHTYKLLTY